MSRMFSGLCTEEQQQQQPVVFTQYHRQFLLEHGYVVIPNVVDQEFCAKALDDLQKVFTAWDQNLTFDNPSAWKADALPAGTMHGINRLTAHSQAQWDVRQHPRVVQCFTDYWSGARMKYMPDEMVTSMDAFNFYLAAAVKTEGKGWAHTDQERDRKEPLDGKCVQGLLNLISCEGDNDGGLVVWDKGHRAWRGYFDKNPLAPNEKPRKFERYPDDFLRAIERDGRAYLQPQDPLFGSAVPLPMARVRVRAPAGAMVLWFSKTPHENDAPFIRNNQLPRGNNRAVIYVCMCPKSYLTPKDTKKRKQAFTENRQTSHWPAGDRVKMFPKTFKAYSVEKGQSMKVSIPRFLAHPHIKKKPVLTKLGKSVLGV